MLEKLTDRMNTANACSFGILHFLWENKNRPSLWSKDFYDKTLELMKVKSYDPDNDYFCASGVMSANLQMTALLVVEYGLFRSLLYNGDKYVVVELGEKFEEEEYNATNSSENLPAC